jgi:hypothetical protein
MEHEMPHHASFIPPGRETPKSMQEARAKATLEAEDLIRNAHETMKQSRALLDLADEILARR